MKAVALHCFVMTLSPFFFFLLLSYKVNSENIDFFSEINSLYFKLQTYMLYTKTDTKGDLVFISDFKQNCGFQGYITRHRDFNESL